MKIHIVLFQFRMIGYNRKMARRGETNLPEVWCTSREARKMTVKAALSESFVTGKKGKAYATVKKY